mmetsp:Transcript_91348/g.295474  ORF Transcript_91348/g.295474 Transcript_91348/m.295474 type:complete len:269 (-) Transcript_91348:514-1320(-)
MSSSWVWKSKVISWCITDIMLRSSLIERSRVWSSVRYSVAIADLPSSFLVYARSREFTLATSCSSLWMPRACEARRSSKLLRFWWNSDRRSEMSLSCADDSLCSSSSLTSFLPRAFLRFFTAASLRLGTASAWGCAEAGLAAVSSAAASSCSSAAIATGSSAPSFGDASASEAAGCCVCVVVIAAGWPSWASCLPLWCKRCFLFPALWLWWLRWLWWLWLSWLWWLWWWACLCPPLCFPCLSARLACGCATTASSCGFRWTRCVPLLY